MWHFFLVLFLSTMGKMVSRGGLINETSCLSYCSCNTLKIKSSSNVMNKISCVVLHAAPYVCACLCRCKCMQYSWKSFSHRRHCHQRRERGRDEFAWQKSTCEGNRMKQIRVSVFPPVIGVKLDQMNCFSEFACFLSSSAVLSFFLFFF